MYFKQRNFHLPSQEVFFVLLVILSSPFIFESRLYMCNYFFLEWHEKSNYEAIRRKNISERRNHWCKGPEIEVWLMGIGRSPRWLLCSWNRITRAGNTKGGAQRERRQWEEYIVRGLSVIAWVLAFSLKRHWGYWAQR